VSFMVSHRKDFCYILSYFKLSLLYFCV